jgi:O-antigen ligase
VLRKIHLILLICIVSTLPFDIDFSFTGARLNNMFIVLLAIVTSISASLHKKRPPAAFLPGVAFFIGMYLIYVAGLLYTENLKQGFFELEKKAGLILFPLMFCFSPARSRNDIRKILAFFCVSCVLTGLTCALIAAYRYISIGDTRFFFYHELSQIVGMHAAYLSMYCSFTIVILVYFLVSKDHLRRNQQIIVWCAIAMTTIFIFLLAGRIQIALLIFGAIVYFGYRFSKKNNVIVGALKAMVIGCLIFAAAFLFPTNRERFKQAINYKNQYGLSGEWGEQQMRPLIWSCVFESFANAPIFGRGTGDTQDVLQECYIKNDYVSLLIWEPVRFNAHNQFFEIAIGLGIIGLLVFVASLATSLLWALRHRDGLYFAFIIIFVVSCMTESLLQRHHGIVFYSFFNAFLFFYGARLQGPSTEHRLQSTGT